MNDLVRGSIGNPQNFFLYNTGERSYVIENMPVILFSQEDFIILMTLG